ncbi:hypothetical protein PInf_027590 [Phytophthora infestans]|nr:hypothetical protein PInf_027590 [Phytophthora infestans]
MAKDIALDLDEEAEAADDQLVGAGSKNRETTAVDEPDYINKDDGENLAEITGAGDGETAACPLPVAGHEANRLKRTATIRLAMSNTPLRGRRSRGDAQLTKLKHRAVATVDKSTSG